MFGGTFTLKTKSPTSPAPAPAGSSAPITSAITHRVSPGVTAVASLMMCLRAPAGGRPPGAAFAPEIRGSREWLVGLSGFEPRRLIHEDRVRAGRDDGRARRG